MSNKVFEVTAELKAFIQSQETKRKNSIIIEAARAEEITIELLSKPENLHRLIPRFLSGKLREGYKVSKIIEIKGPLGYN